MKKLSMVLSNISCTAGSTDSSHVASRSSLIRSGGKMITLTQQLQQKTAQDNDKDLEAYLKHTLKLPMNTQKKVVFDDRYGCDFQPNVEFGNMTHEQVQAAEEVINTYMQPMDKTEILKLIARLQMICPEREKNNIDIKARTAIWIEELIKYPADITNQALRQKYRWFPSLAEVLDYCDNEVAFRKLLSMGIRARKNY